MQAAEGHLDPAVRLLKQIYLLYEFGEEHEVTGGATWEEWAVEAEKFLKAVYPLVVNEL